MLGRATASLEGVPRRWLQYLWGYAEIHARQQWVAVWPHLARLPKTGVSLVDAGCGAGRWTLELAARRPGWRVVGVDLEQSHVQRAETARQKLGLSNVSFIHSDFLDYRPEERFDVVLSVASAHYLVEAGKGTELFRCFRSWLKPQGSLLLLGPRRVCEAPFVPWLAHPPWHPVFSRDEFFYLCSANELVVEGLDGRIGRLGTLAKQLSWTCTGSRRPLAIALYPFQWALSLIDAHVRLPSERSTLMWLLMAQRREEVAPPDGTVA